jgi:hypothetical protein
MQLLLRNESVIAVIKLFLLYTYNHNCCHGAVPVVT